MTESKCVYYRCGRCTSRSRCQHKDKREDGAVACLVSGCIGTVEKSSGDLALRRE